MTKKDIDIQCQIIKAFRDGAPWDRIGIVESREGYRVVVDDGTIEEKPDNFGRFRSKLKENGWTVEV